jgi:hypothetical protein
MRGALRTIQNIGKAPRRLWQIRCIEGDNCPRRPGSGEDNRVLRVKTFVRQGVLLPLKTFPTLIEHGSRASIGRHRVARLVPVFGRVLMPLFDGND